MQVCVFKRLGHTQPAKLHVVSAMSAAQHLALSRNLALHELERQGVPESKVLSLALTGSYKVSPPNKQRQTTTCTLL
jgi:hypothetical protein